jgi:hypothetical protein
MLEVKIPQADEYSAVELCDVYSACSSCLWNCKLYNKMIKKFIFFF